MNLLNILYFKVVDEGKVVPITPQAQALFDEVVLNFAGNHIEQLEEWNEEQNPKLILQFLE
jgi:hypothetical protein